MSTLSELRTEFKYYSGRYDLTDARIDAFIVAGQDYLDQLRVLPQRRVTVESTPAAGTYYLLIAGLLSFHELRIRDSNNNFVATPSRVLYDDFIADWPMYENAAQSHPMYYCQAPIGSATLLDTARINFTPAFNGSYKLFYIADVKQSKLVDDGDYNVWSVSYEDVLLDAALMMLEKKYRNTEGVNDYIRSIAQRVAGLDMQSAGIEDPGYSEIQG